MKVYSLSVGPIGTNCYIIDNEKDSIIIDPGGDGDRIKEYVSAKRINDPVAILLTHAHYDHIGAVDELRNHYKIEVYLNELEHPWLEDPNLNGSHMFGNGLVVKPVENDIEEGKMQLESFLFEARHTPGHSPGSMSFIFHEDNLIFGGDVLFREGVGRTDLTGGNFKQLEDSIRNVFYTLDGNYIVLPGHGPKTTIAHEQQNNPFIRY